MYNPLLAEKFADKILLHGQNALFLKRDIFPGGGGGSQLSHPTVNFTVVVNHLLFYKIG